MEGCQGSQVWVKVDRAGYSEVVGFRHASDQVELSFDEGFHSHVRLRRRLSVSQRWLYFLLMKRQLLSKKGLSWHAVLLFEFLVRLRTLAGVSRSKR